MNAVAKQIIEWHSAVGDTELDDETTAWLMVASPYHDAARTVRSEGSLALAACSQSSPPSRVCRNHRDAGPGLHAVAAPSCQRIEADAGCQLGCHTPFTVFVRHSGTCGRSLALRQPDSCPGPPLSGALSSCRLRSPPSLLLVVPSPMSLCLCHLTYDERAALELLLCFASVLSHQSSCNATAQGKGTGYTRVSGLQLVGEGGLSVPALKAAKLGTVRDALPISALPPPLPHTHTPLPVPISNVNRPT